MAEVSSVKDYVFTLSIETCKDAIYFHLPDKAYSVCDS